MMMMAKEKEKNVENISILTLDYNFFLRDGDEDRNTNLTPLE